MAILLPVLAIGAIRAIQGMCVAPEKWAPPTFEARRTYDEFAARFETGDVVIVSWDGCTIDDRRLATLETILTASQDGSDFSSIVGRVVSGRGMVEELTSPPLNLSREEAIGRLTGTLIGPDRVTSCAVIVLTPNGNNHRRNSIQKILAVVENECGIGRKKIHIVGPPVNGVAIDDASIKGINLFANLSLAISVLLCWFHLRSWFYTLTIVGTGVFGQALSLAAVHFAGYQLDAILIIIPSLVLVLTVSAGVHLVNYYRDEIQARGVDGAAERALRKGMKPCLLSAATTAIGIGSLVASQITPVMMFGAIASLAVLCSVAALLLVLPGAMELIPLSQINRTDQQKPSAIGSLAHRLLKRPNLIAFVSLAVMLSAMIGLPRLTTTVDVVSLFSKQSPLVNDYEWFEKNIGESVPIEVLVSFDRECQLSVLQRIQFVDRIAQHIEESADFSGTISAATLAPNMNFDGGLQQRLLRTAVLNRRLSRDLDKFVDARLLSVTDSEESWRISARTTALDGPDYADSLGMLRSQIAGVVESRFPDQPITVRYTGMMTLASTVQQAVLDDLRNSFLTAVVLVAAVMMLTLRSFVAGLLSMLPNVFPVVVIFGCMGLCGVALDIGMIMTASVALGIAIDDTLHFLTWYRRETTDGAASSDAVASSIRHCGRAMIQTTVICGLGLLAFSQSDFVPTQQFAFMMCVLLLTALAADLIFLPAVILSPLGRFFTSTSATARDLPSARRLNVDHIG